MASFREANETLLLAYDEDLINDEEFVLLYNLNTSKNFDYSYWNYNRFNLDDWSDEECRSDLRFYEADVYRLFEVSNIPEVLITYNRSKCDGAMMPNAISDQIYNNFNHLLHEFDQPWNRLVLLQEYSGKIHEKGASLENCFDFINGV